MTRLLIPIIIIAIFMSFFRLGSVTLFDVDEAVEKIVMINPFFFTG
ncbi:MAG: hypothetical protein NT055_03475 [Nitrospirae bacterium]|nr:hypothetical protein [Nitrospirota bacterium]